MPEKAPIDQDAIAAGHETAEIHARGVVWKLAGLVVILALVFLAVRCLQGFFSIRNASSTTNFWAGTSSPGPRLQVDEARDLRRLRQQENSNLNSYGWIDQKAGLARIPIEQAMQIVAQHGLPPTPSPGKTRLEMRQERANAEKPRP